MARIVINQDKIKEINILYLKLKTYAAVARELGIAPSTVKKYIIPNFTLVTDVVKFDDNLIKPVNLNLIAFNNKDICTLTDIEIIEIEELWKEIMI